MTQAQSLWHQSVKPGVIGGLAALAIALVGMVESFDKRYIVADVITMGIVLILLVAILIAYSAAKKTEQGRKGVAIKNAVIAALVTSGFLALLVMISKVINIRAVLINASPALNKILMGGVEGAAGIFIILLVGLLCGIFAGVLYLIPELIRRVVIISLSSVLMAGLLQDLIRPVMAPWSLLAIISDWLYT
ncbi:MAG: hypothetical protein HKO68_14965, partial [Desulfobacterales bacterium]|nr:hypothetical protein [Desulfobacterales bacterium]